MADAANIWTGRMGDWRAQSSENAAATFYRWCNVDLENSGFQYVAGHNVHPQPEVIPLPHKPKSLSDPLHWFWFARTAEIIKYATTSGRYCGPRLFKVEIPDSASIYMDKTRGAGRCSEFTLTPVCALCEITRLYNEKQFTRSWQELLLYVKWGSHFSALAEHSPSCDLAELQN
jgi:hypothetical protein